jgi:two-component system, sensor histidine kinase and response regulator
MTRGRDQSAEVVLDLTELLSRVDNDRDLLRELIEIFKEEFPRLLDQLKVNIVRREIKSAERACHGLKGMLSGLSAIRATTVASHLEEMSREGDFLGLSESVAHLEEEAKRLLLELDSSVAEREH